MKGYFISGQAPYGYGIDPENNNHLIIDPTAALNVRLIFQLAEDGNTLREIAAIMTNKRVLSPGMYKAQNGDTRFSRYNKDDKISWCVATIAQILEDPVYTGSVVNHKGEVKNYKTKVRRKVPKEEWIIVENMHEPIISKELFDHVQEILSLKAHPRRHQFENVLEGCVFCGECGHRMTQATKKRMNGERFLLRCTHHFTHPEECKRNHAIFYDDLVEQVQNDIELHLAQMGSQKVFAVPLTRSTVLQWIDYKAVRDMVPVDSVSGLTYEQARGMEEIGMQYYHTLRGKFPNNIVHGISPYNPNKEMYIFDTIGYLENKAENELLNFIDGGI